MKITQSDIAKALNISRLTVSKVLNNAQGVSGETRAMVLKEARNLGYQRLAKSQIEAIEHDVEVDKATWVKSLKQVSLFFEQKLMTDSYWAPVIRGMMEVFAANGYNLNLCFLVPISDEEFELPMNFNPDENRGIIQFGNVKKRNIEQFKSCNLPMVSVDAVIHGEEANLYSDTIMSFNVDPMTEMVQYLVSQGYQRIGYASDGGSQLTMHERWRGYCKGMEKEGLPINQRHCFFGSFENVIENIEKENRLAYFNDFPDAIVCVNDVLAIAFMKYFQANGIKVPDMIALTGYDNVSESEVADITTINVNAEELGRTTAETLLWRIENPDRPYRIIRINDNKLIVRGSTNKRK